tara:strand:+ start:2368 stop:3453 length:1086 start_codon:yes stop_codon:yes gene_type:complete
MPKRSRIVTEKDYEPKRRNPITLGDDSNVDTNLKVIKVDTKNTILELSDSELKVRGAIDASAITVDGASVQTGTGGGATELNDLSDVTYSSGDLTISSLDTIVSGALTIDSSGDITLDAAGEQINFDNAGTTFGTIDTSSPSKLHFTGATNYAVIILSQGTGDITLNSADNITIDATDSLIIDNDGTYIMKKDGTEFSAANSAYAGMILGYTDIGLNEAHANHILTTSFVVPTDEHCVTFTAPPSGNVEIWCQFGQTTVGSSGMGSLSAGLSTANATDGYSALASYHEEGIIDSNARHAYFRPNNSWTLTGLTAGTSYTYWVGVKSASTTGTPRLYWGGNSANRYPDFIMKAIALPATIST